MQFFSCFDSEQHLERCRYNHNCICLTVTFAWTRAMAMLRMEHESEGLKEDDGGTSGMCNRKSRWKIRSGILHFTAEYIFASLLYGVKAMATPACAVLFTLQNEPGTWHRNASRTGSLGLKFGEKKIGKLTVAEHRQLYVCDTRPWNLVLLPSHCPATLRWNSQCCVVSINCVIS